MGPHSPSGWKLSAADAIDAETTERLLDRLRELPELTRRVVILRKVYGLSQAQIASRLGITLEQVMEHVLAAVNACADQEEIPNMESRPC